MEEQTEILDSVDNTTLQGDDVPSSFNSPQDPMIRIIIEKLCNLQAPSNVAANLGARLLNAAIEGNVPCLLNLLQEDPLLLNRCRVQKSSSFMQSPLHIAIYAGHLEFTKELLRHKPDLTEEIDQLKGALPIHVASAKGHLEIVKALLTVSPNMCFARDQNGRNPFHVAAIHGQNHVLEELLRANPQVARELSNEGESVMHLCVKYSQTEALKLLLNVADDVELLNSKDSDGNTVLHLAVVAKQLEIVKLLLQNKRLEKNVINKKGSTAMDALNRSRKDENDREIWKSLKHAKVLHAKDTLEPKNNKHAAWIKKQRNALMVVATLIATIAFQVGVNPPGNVWEDTTTMSTNNTTVHIAGTSILADTTTMSTYNNTTVHIAGTSILADTTTMSTYNNTTVHIADTSILADTYPTPYDLLMVSNTIALVSSLSVVLLLISGLPCKRLFVVILTMTMWIAVTTTTITYCLSVIYLSGNDKNTVVIFICAVSLMVFLILLLILLLGNGIRVIYKLIRKIKQLWVKLWKRYEAKATNRPPV